MNAIVIEHVPVTELPQAWRDKLSQAADAHVTVRIEAEDQAAAAATEEFVTDDPAFGYLMTGRREFAEKARDNMAAGLRRFLNILLAGGGIADCSLSCISLSRPLRAWAGTLDLIRREVDDIVAVSDDEVAAAMRAMFSDTHNAAEGAGAASLAAALQQRDRWRGQSIGVTLCGGNVDRALFARVLAAEEGKPWQ